MNGLTLKEKIALVSGHNFMYTNGIERANIPEISMADGPHGLRKQTGELDNGVSMSAPSTAFPTASCTANGWNNENLYKMGVAIGKECRHYGVNVLLGPGVNIKRNALCGRNFEYFSEDPLLSGKLGASMIKGVQSQGVGACVKHFALNNSENFRFMSDSVCDYRAMHEIYLKSFEYAVKEGKPDAVICAYNKINGEYCSQNEWLLTDILRKQWQYDGIVMTDWGAMHDRVKSIKAGLDLEMPGDTAICKKNLYDAVNDNSLEEQVLDNSAQKIAKLALKYQETEKIDADFELNHKLSGEIAQDCAVLLKNDGNVLPLSENEKILVVGELFERMRYQGSGSSMINATKITTPKNAFDENGVLYEYQKGYSIKDNNASVQIEKAVERAKEYEKIVLFIGLTDLYESEGFDRENLKLPKNQLDLIEKLSKLNKKLIIVLFGGSVVELDFSDKVNAILNMFLPGQNGGSATYNLLFGKVNPSGKLAETYVNSINDIPFVNEYSKNQIEVYKESIFVGYRYYLSKGVKVKYPFGYGLSYTTFSYSDIEIERNGDKIRVSCTLENTGSCFGAEVVQLYVRAPETKIYKAIKELKGYKKVYLKQGEKQKIDIEVSLDQLKYYNVQLNRFVLDGGEYLFEICSDSTTVKLSTSLYLDGKNLCPYEQSVLDCYNNDLTTVSNEIFERMSGVKSPNLPTKKPITMNSRLTDLNSTLLGKILFKSIMLIPKKQLKRAKRLIESAEKDNKIKGAIFLRRMLESNTLNCMSMAEGRRFPYNFAQGVMHLSNGKIFKAVKCFIKKIK